MPIVIIIHKCSAVVNIENDSSKYRMLRLRYQHEHKREMYRELPITGKRTQHRKAIDTAACEQSEQIQAAWLKNHPMPLEDRLERIRLWTQAIADEIALAELIYT